MEDPTWAVEALYVHYARVNREKFSDSLPDNYAITFNPRLRRLTGRITYGARLIEISSFHYSSYGFGDAKATLEHEMLHLYLHTLHLPSGHTQRFKELAERLEIRVYHNNDYQKNSQPRTRYLYQCPHCGRMVFRKRPIGSAKLACGPCCRELAQGEFDGRFALYLVDKIKLA